MKNNDPILNFLTPWIFIYGMCVVMILIVGIDLVFGLGLTR